MNGYKVLLGRLSDGMSLRARLFWIILLSSLVPFIVTLILFHNNSRKALEEQIGAYTVEIAKQVDQQLDAFVEEAERLADVIRFNKDVQFFLEMERLTYDYSEQSAMIKVRELIGNLLVLRSNMKGIFIINDHKLVAYNAGSKVIDFDYRYEEQTWYRLIRETEKISFLPPREQTYVSGDPVITFAIRLMNHDGVKPAGTLILDFNPEFIAEKIKHLHIGRTGYVFMMTEAGELVELGEPRQEDSFTDQLLGSQSMQQSSGYFVDDSADGESMLVSFSTSSKTGWKIVCVVPFREVASGIQQMRFTLILIGICFVLLVFLVSTYFSRKITQPFKQFESSMKRAEKGDFTIRIPIDGKDEIGRLANNFNHMLKQLAHLKEEVYMATISEYKHKLMSKESELKALQAQINPHFLYNTLNTMSCIGEVYELEEVTSISRNLAEMFKYSMEGENFERLEDELGHVLAYFRIVQIRYPGRFNIHIQVPFELQSCYLLKLTLQPLVENAVQHGLVPKNREGKVVISACIVGEDLSITVADDGIGIPDNKLPAIRQSVSREDRRPDRKHASIGLSNVRKRLRLYYGNRATLEISSNEWSGTTVSIQMPVNRDGEHKVV